MSTVTQEGRQERFEALVAEAYPPLQRFLRRRTDRSTADDVLGDTLLVLWRRLDDVPPDAPLAWSYGVARGCLANAVRTDRRRLRLVHRLVAEPVAPPPEADPALHEALESLPAPDREVLRLWAWEGLAPREIALVLDVTPNAASIRLHRALAKLRKILPARKDDPAAGQQAQRQGTETPR